MAPYHVRMYERRLDSNTAPCITLKVPKGPSAPQDPLKAVYDSAGRNLAIPQLPVASHDLGSRSLSSPIAMKVPRWAEQNQMCRPWEMPRNSEPLILRFAQGSTLAYQS